MDPADLIHARRTVPPVPMTPDKGGRSLPGPLRQTPCVTIVYNTTLYVVKFRMNLIRCLQRAGFRVVVISPPDEYVVSLTCAGVTHEPVSMSQYGRNPFGEVRTLCQMVRLFVRYRPVASLHFTIKPNTFGNIAAALAGVPTISNIAGVGQALCNSRPLLRFVASVLYRVALRRVRCVFFQNKEDMRLFLSRRLTPSHLARRIPGSGVDLTSFQSSPLPRNEVRFLFVGRLLKEKGIAEFVQAGRSMVAAGRNGRFVIAGEFEAGARGIAASDFEYVQRTPEFTYLGAVAPCRMQDVLRSASCVVLPSYYGEGVPRSLLEACASGRPIITTDNVGCRDVVDHGVNGFQVPVRDVDALASAMMRFAELPHHEKQAMGHNGRLKMQREFDEKVVLDAYMEEVTKVANATSRLLA